MQLILLYFAYFFIYSVIGWAAETIFVKIKTGKFVDRGFLIGPYCPIYGCGALVMILYLTQYKDNVLTIFLLGVIICSVLEYFTSYIMEFLFKTRWWDYSNKKFNLNGRICGENSILFGLGGILVIYIIHPLLVKLLSLFSQNILMFIIVIIFFVFIIDLICSFNIINRFKKTLTSMELKKDSTQDISKYVKEIITNNHKIFQKRLVKAFPNINFNKIINLKNELKDELKEFLTKDE